MDTNQNNQLQNMMNEIDFRKHFGTKLNTLRKQKGLTQSELAFALNYSDKAVSKWERGESAPDIYVLYKMSELFSCSVNDLIGQEEKNPVSEKLDELDEFHPDRMASRILGMGDMLSLIEKAEKAFDAEKAAKLEENLKSNKFTLQDFYDQMVQLKSMGSMQDLLAQLPGGAGLKNVQLDEKAMARTEAIILSMTPKERENPNIIAASRKRRIANGAGVKVEDVNRLLKSFEQMRAMIKQFSGPGAGKKMKRMGRMGGFGGFPGF